MVAAIILTNNEYSNIYIIKLPSLNLYRLVIVLGKFGVIYTDDFLKFLNKGIYCFLGKKKYKNLYNNLLFYSNSLITSIAFCGTSSFPHRKLSMGHLSCPCMPHGLHSSLS